MAGKCSPHAQCCGEFWSAPSAAAVLPLCGRALCDCATYWTHLLLRPWVRADMIFGGYKGPPSSAGASAGPPCPTRSLVGHAGAGCMYLSAYRICPRRDVLRRCFYVSVTTPMRRSVLPQSDVVDQGSPAWRASRPRVGAARTSPEHASVISASTSHSPETQHVGRAWSWLDLHRPKRPLHFVCIAITVFTVVDALTGRLQWELK